MAKLLTTTILLGVFSLFWTPGSYACSCILLTLKQQFQMADHVFIADITQVRETQSRPSHPQWAGVLADFQLKQGFKGNPNALRNIETGFGKGDCGVGLVAGHTYLLFADKMGAVDICSGSRAFDPEDPKNKQVLKELQSYSNVKPGA